jgi:predicted ATPase
MLASNKEDFFGRNLLERISKTRSNIRDSYLRKIGDFLKIAVPNLEELKFIDKKESSDGESHFEARYKHWRPSGAKQSERQFSDGTLRIIGFMWALLDGNETILLEEPELYLNTEIVKQIPEFIYKFQKKRKGVRQVIVTTHSYDLLNTQSISSNEIIMLENNEKGGTSIKSAAYNKRVVAQIRAGFTPAEAAFPLIAPKDVAESFAQLNLFD